MFHFWDMKYRISDYSIYASDHPGQLLVLLGLLIASLVPNLMKSRFMIKRKEPFWRGLLLAILLLSVMIVLIKWVNPPIFFFSFPITVGILVFFNGVEWFHLFALMQLGQKNFEDDAAPNQNCQLMTRGLYGVVRHPVYAALFLKGLTMALFTPLLSLLGLITLSIPIHRLVVMKEEVLLIQRFGGHYQAYMKQTPYRLIPFVY